MSGTEKAKIFVVYMVYFNGGYYNPTFEGKFATFSEAENRALELMALAERRCEVKIEGLNEKIEVVVRWRYSQGKKAAQTTYNPDGTINQSIRFY